jgi:hypothetical protein
MLLLVRFYARRRGIQWLFQAIDSKCCLPRWGVKQAAKVP